tara:strand:- start:68 stop:394 length:327 start_codon:yes stop_codon:yes gene_type:complete
MAELFVRTQRKLVVTAEPVTETSRIVNCYASATADLDLKGITIYLHAFNYMFEKGETYTVYFDTEFMPRSIVLNNLQSTGNAAKSYLALSVPHAFTEATDRCFIHKHK